MVPKTIIFDFDGTMAVLFTKTLIAETTAVLHKAMQEIDIDFPYGKDPFDIFKVIKDQTQYGRQRVKAFSKAGEILTLAEMKGLQYCELVPGVKEAVKALHDDGVNIGITSNNSFMCINAFTHLVFPDIHIPAIGRVPNRPELMKPNPWPLLETIMKTGTPKENVVFVGDLPSDYYCSQAAGCRFIGMASSEDKFAQLSKLIPTESIVTDFHELLYQVHTSKTHGV